MINIGEPDALNAFGETCTQMEQLAKGNLGFKQGLRAAVETVTGVIIYRW
jgi:hypothetical protein